jgi:hypothetical protein
MKQFRKIYFLFFFILCFQMVSISQVVDSVIIPKGVVYNYCSPKTLETAKSLILQELSDACKYRLNSGACFVGPGLWRRFRLLPDLNSIEGGNITIGDPKNNVTGKLTQRDGDFKLIWDEIKSETKNLTPILRKATPSELMYYWSVISFDIEEPLLIAETSEHRYLFNLSNKDFTLVWLDEIPSSVKK